MTEPLAYLSEWTGLDPAVLNTALAWLLVALAPANLFAVAGGVRRGWHWLTTPPSVPEYSSFAKNVLAQFGMWRWALGSADPYVVNNSALTVNTMTEYIAVAGENIEGRLTRHERAAVLKAARLKRAELVRRAAEEREAKILDALTKPQPK